MNEKMNSYVYSYNRLIIKLINLFNYELDCFDKSLSVLQIKILIITKLN